MRGPTQRKGRALGRGLLTRAREDVVRVAVHSELGRGRDGAARGRRAARWFRRSTSRRLRAVQGLRLAVGGVDRAGRRSWRSAGGARVRGAGGACAGRSWAGIGCWAGVGSKFGSLFFAGQHANEKNRGPICMLGWRCS